MFSSFWLVYLIIIRIAPEEYYVWSEVSGTQEDKYLQNCTTLFNSNLICRIWCKLFS